MKLVFEYHWSVEGEAEGTCTIPFEYSSIEDFQFMVLEKIKEHKERFIKEKGKKDGIAWYRNGSVEVLGADLNVGNLEDDIEHYVFTLEDWFEQHKLKEK